MLIAYPARWVLISKFCEFTGYTQSQIENYIIRGIWIEGIHWRVGPNKRRHINLEAYNAWVEGNLMKASG